MRKFSFILFLVFAAAMTRAQVPNNGFENWSTVGAYDMPDQWDNLNPSTAGTGIFTCTKGTPGSTGNSFLKLTATEVPGMGVVPGIAVCGALDQASRLQVSGYPFSLRPASFAGKWQYMMYGSGIGYMDVTLTRWDAPTASRKVVAICHQALSGMVMIWRNFDIPFTYYDGQQPDTCMIFLSSSGAVPAADDFLWLDELQFQGSVDGIDAGPGSVKHLYVSPNPANGSFSARFYSESPDQLALRLFDSRGMVVCEQKVEATQGENETEVDTRSLPAGLYLLKLGSGSFGISKKVVIQ
ncbi:MAG: T9SS type A sorting domain-containing protein [Bacteroidetes bacterium]|nr:T9SS type A sorting domain-containing protein [Bacteroidota bacterium]